MSIQQGNCAQMSQPVGDVAIYALTDPRDGAVRYIGKAVDAAKRYAQHIGRSRGPRPFPVHRWICKLASIGLRPVLEIVERCPHAEWQQAERDLIAECRRLGFPLLNVADGGDEPSHGRTEREKRLWRLKRNLGGALRRGQVPEPVKAKMRARPDVFGQWAAYL